MKFRDYVKNEASYIIGPDYPNPGRMWSADYPERIGNWEKMKGPRLGPGYKNKKTGVVVHWFNPMFAGNKHWNVIVNPPTEEGKMVYHSSKGENDAWKFAEKYMKKNK